MDWGHLLATVPCAGVVAWVTHRFLEHLERRDKAHVEALRQVRGVLERLVRKLE